MEWFQYLLESNLYLILGFICFYLTLRRETFYTFNRWYLISITVLSFLLPLCSISWVEATSEQSAKAFQANFKILTSSQYLVTKQNLVERIDPTLTWLTILQFIYVIVVALAILKVLFGVFKIVKLYVKSPKLKKNSITHICLTSEKNVFSFFSWVFYHPSLKDNDAIMAHELVHVKGRHSLDLIFFDIVTAFNWFNPFVYSLFRAVKINHEFIADAKASQKMNDKYEYAKLLINHVGGSYFRLGHSISSSSQLENRIVQLGRKQSPNYRLFQFLLIVPFILVTLILFSAFTANRSYRVFAYHPTNSNSIQKIIPKIDHQVSLSDLANKSIPLYTLPEKNRSKGNSPIKNRADQLKKRVNALDLLYDWTINDSGNKIRKIKHSIFEGKEAQLFRGEIADTLYVDQSDFKLNGNEVEVMVDQLMIGSTPLNQNKKQLVIIDAKKEMIINILDQVSIKTKGMIHEVRMVAQDATQTKPNLLAYNMRVQYALVNEAQIFVEKEDNKAPFQPGILW